MSLVAYDTFTGAAGTDLAAHAPDSGGSWSALAFQIVITDANRARGNTAASRAVYAHSAVPASAEYDVQADIYFASTLFTDAGPAGRVADASNLYVGRWNSTGGGRWELVKIVAGVVSVLGTWANAPLAGDTVTVKLELRDAAKKLYVAGVAQISSGDNSLAAAGSAGIRALVSGNATGQHLDNWSCTDTSTAAATAPSGSSWPTVRKRRALLRRRRKDEEAEELLLFGLIRRRLRRRSRHTEGE